MIEGVVQIAVDGSGNTILLGDTGSKTFVEKRDRAGEFVLRRLSSGSTEYEEPVAVAASTNGDIAFVGRFHGTINFGGSDLVWAYPSTSSAPYTTAFIVKLDGAGNHVFSRMEGSSGIGHIGSIAVDPTGKVTWTWNSYDAITSGYVTAYDARTGATLWAHEGQPRFTGAVRMNDAGETFWLTHDTNAAPTLTKYAP
jgi:hypothetical protein